MKFLKTTTTETSGGTKTAYDNIQDPQILSSQLLNTKKSYRHKKYTHIRISEIGSFCPREYAIGFLTDSATESFIDFPLQQQFDLGSALHWYYQNKSKVFKDVLCGYFKCKACNNFRKNKDSTQYFGTKPDTDCETCGALKGATEYDEFMFRVDEPYRVVGKIDGVLMKDGVYRFIDFKSYWQKPASGFPAGKDVAQLASYAYFYSLLPDEMKFPVPIDTSTAYLHYISKKFSYGESLLTYPIKPTDKMITTIVDRVSQFTEAAKTGNVPKPFDPCVRSEFKTGKAKECGLASLCQQYYYEG